MAPHLPKKTIRDMPRPLATSLMLLAFLALSAVAGCGGSEGRELDPGVFDPLVTLPQEVRVDVAGFGDGGSVPVELTCDGEDRAPRISWSTLPAATRSIAIIMDDPDAPGGIFNHWTVYNLPAGARSIGPGTPAAEVLEGGAMQGVNGFGKTGYGGPCPPRGPAHEYRVFVFALNASLALGPGASAVEVLTAMRGSVIGQGQTSGMYARR